MDSQKFQFFHNLRRTNELVLSNITDYLKNDMKYLIKPLIILFILFIGWLYFSYVKIIFNSNNSLYVGLFLLYVWSAFEFKWIMYSKAYDVYTLYSNPGISYKENLDAFKTFNDKKSESYFIRILKTALISVLGFIGFILFTIIAFLALSIVIGILTLSFHNGILLTGQILLLNIASLLIFGLLFTVPTPTKLFSSNLFKKETLIDSIKDPVQLFKNKKIKLKFLIFELFLIPIYGIIGELLFLNVLVLGSVLTFLFTSIILGLFHLFTSIAPPTFISAFGPIMVFIFLFGIAIEVAGSLIGTVYSQSYINITNPSLEKTYGEYNFWKLKYDSYPIYCTHCGDLIKNPLMYCSNCGQPI